MRAEMYFVIVLCLPFTLIASAELTAQEIFDSVPNNEKRYFLAYQVAKTISRSKEVYEDMNKWDIPDDLKNKFQVMNVPDDFPANLCKWLSRNTNATYEEFMDQMRDCLNLHTETNCALLDYPGGNCCPF